MTKLESSRQMLDKPVGLLPLERISILFKVPFTNYSLWPSIKKIDFTLMLHTILGISQGGRNGRSE